MMTMLAAFASLRMGPDPLTNEKHPPQCAPSAEMWFDALNHLLLLHSNQFESLLALAKSLRMRCDRRKSARKGR